jgi:hypothetical protein
VEQERRALIIVRAAAAAAAVLSSPSTSRAESDDAARSIAQPLFDDAVKLMEEARCDDENITPDRRPRCRDALAKFKKAFDIYPAGLGALRNAAFCERGLGMFASATRDFREVARRAPLDPNPSKQLWAKHAAEEADKLGKLVPHVVVTVETKGARVRIDDADIPAAAYGVPIPLDPGDHVVVAEAAGHVALRRTIELEPKEDLAIVVRLAPIPTPPPPRRRESPSYALPIAFLGAGVAVLGAGLGLGYAAKHARDDACDGGSPLRCHDEAGLDRARRYARASTIVTVASGALLATSAVVFVVKSSHGREVAVALQPAGFAFVGAF